MKAHVVLADYSQPTGDGKINALGLGWSACQSPTPPMGVVVLMVLDAEEVKKYHNAVLTLVDRSGVPILPNGVDPLKLEVGFEATPAPGMENEFAHMPFTFQIGPGIDLEPGRYSWRLSILELRGKYWEAPFVVLPTPADHA